MWSKPKPNVALSCVSTNDQMIQSNAVPPIDGIYLDYLRHKVDNQAEFDCRQKLKEAELQNFFMVSSKTVSREKLFSVKIN